MQNKYDNLFYKYLIIFLRFCLFASPISVFAFNEVFQELKKCFESKQVDIINEKSIPNSTTNKSVSYYGKENFGNRSIMGASFSFNENIKNDKTQQISPPPSLNDSMNLLFNN